MGIKLRDFINKVIFLIYIFFSCSVFAGAPGLSPASRQTPIPTLKPISDSKVTPAPAPTPVTIAAPPPSRVGVAPMNQDVQSYNIKVIPYSQFISTVNSFQEDCLQSLQSPTTFFNAIEVQRTRMKSIYVLRLTGMVPDNESIELAGQEIFLTEPNGKTESIRFDPNKFGIKRDASGLTVLSFSVPSPRTVRVPLIFHQKVNHRFDLIVDLKAGGSLDNPIFQPRLGFDQRSQLCARSRSALGAMTFLGGHQYDFSSVSGSVQGVAKGSAFKFDYDQVSSQTKSQGLSAQIRNMQSSITEFNLMPSQQKQVRVLSGNYWWQTRRDDLNFPLWSLVVSPYWRYGIGGEEYYLWNFVKADQVQIEKTQSAFGFLGLGFSFYSESRWMFDVSGVLKLQVFGKGALRSSYGFEGRSQLLFQPSWASNSIYLGLDGQLNYLAGQYSRSQGMDQRGQVQFIEVQFGILIGQTF